MKQSTLFLSTLHDPPSDAEVPSHRLLAQAGFIQKLAAGIYTYTPPMWRVLRKVSQIVREEMDRTGAQEVLMPALQPRSIWDESGRWDRYVSDNVLFCLKDRKDADLCLGPTHEEAVTTLVSRFVSSYKQLPVNLYQIQTKFRDEIRPRFGLMRGREFIMKDAYSFDSAPEGMNKSYLAMEQAYRRIFERCGLTFRVVEADSGAIGGSGSQEFIVLAETGEDVVLYCDSCDYAANQEKAESTLTEYPQDAEQQQMEKIFGEGLIGVEPLAKFLNIPVWKTTKTLLLQADDELVAVMVRGDCDVNEVAVKNALGCNHLSLATPEVVKATTGAEVGYAGPIGLPNSVKVLADHYTKNRVNFECGANETNYHNINVNFVRDFPLPAFGNYKLSKGGDGCVRCKKGKLVQARGIEVGHVFKLGQKYSAAMKAHFTDEQGNELPFYMGCYGIGVSRVAAAAIEQWHDEKGMIWPLEIAPWSVHLVCVNPKNEDQRNLADRIYERLQTDNIEVLYDDRPVSAGIKFNDADLVGLPLRLTVGRDATQGVVEFMKRKTRGEVLKLPLDEALAQIKEAFA